MNRQISMTEKKISVPLKIVIFKKRKKKGHLVKNSPYQITENGKKFHL